MTKNTARSIVGSSDGRPPDDFYPTPEYVTQSLLDREVFYGKIWEPACGDGAMSKVLIKNGYDVISSDLIDRNYGHGEIDFLSTQQFNCVENIITNPPFSLSQQFIEHSLKVATDKVAIFGKLALLESKSRKELFLNIPFKKLWVFSSRVKLTRNGEPYKNGGMIAFGWYVFQHGYKGEPTIGWI